jgi:hypothetical protein
MLSHDLIEAGEAANTCSHGDVTGDLTIQASVRSGPRNNTAVSPSFVSHTILDQVIPDGTEISSRLLHRNPSTSEESFEDQFYTHGNTDHQFKAINIIACQSETHDIEATDPRNWSTFVASVCQPQYEGNDPEVVLENDKLDKQQLLAPVSNFGAKGNSISHDQDMIIDQQRSFRLDSTPISRNAIQSFHLSYNTITADRLNNLVNTLNDAGVDTASNLDENENSLMVVVKRLKMSDTSFDSGNNLLETRLPIYGKQALHQVSHQNVSKADQVTSHPSYIAGLKPALLKKQSGESSPIFHVLKTVEEACKEMPMLSTVLEDSFEEEDCQMALRSLPTIGQSLKEHSGKCDRIVIDRIPNEINIVPISSVPDARLRSHEIVNSRSTSRGSSETVVHIPNSRPATFLITPEAVRNTLPPKLGSMVFDPVSKSWIHEHGCEEDPFGDNDSTIRFIQDKAIPLLNGCDGVTVQEHEGLCMPDMYRIFDYQNEQYRTPEIAVASDIDVSQTKHCNETCNDQTLHDASISSHMISILGHRIRELDMESTFIEGSEVADDDLAFHTIPQKFGLSSGFLKEANISDSRCKVAVPQFQIAEDNSLLEREGDVSCSTNSLLDDLGRFGESRLRFFQQALADLKKELSKKNVHFSKYLYCMISTDNLVLHRDKCDKNA